VEGGIYNSGRIIQTNSNALWLDKLTYDTLDNNEKDFTGLDQYYESSKFH